MNDTITIKATKKSLSTAIKALFAGYKKHAKYSDAYKLSLSVATPGLVTARVLGGEYTFEAETEGTGSFSVSYRWFRLFVKDCKMKQICMAVNGVSLCLNNTATIKVEYTTADINVPLSLFYTPGEITRVDWPNINEQIIDYWGLKPQIEEAENRIKDVINTVYIKLADYLPPNSTESKIKEKIREIIAGESMC